LFAVAVYYTCSKGPEVIIIIVVFIVVEVIAVVIVVVADLLINDDHASSIHPPIPILPAGHPRLREQY